MIIQILESLSITPCDLAKKCGFDASKVHKIVHGGNKPTLEEANRIQFAIGELGAYLDVLTEWPHLQEGSTTGREDVLAARESGMVVDDVDEFHREVCYEADYATEIDTIEEVLSEMNPKEFAEYLKKQLLENERRVAASVLRRAVAFLVGDKSPKNAKVCAVGLAFAGGLDIHGGNTMKKVAEEMCLTRAAISKVANQAADALGIKRNLAYMRTESAREAYRKRAKEVHGRKG